MKNYAPILIIPVVLFMLFSCDFSSRYDEYFFASQYPNRLETLPDDVRIVQIGVEDHTLALDEDGNVWAWGSNNSGRLGAGEGVDDQYLPLNISRLESSPLNGVTIKQISAGAQSLVLDEDGNVWVWGFNWHGQLGTGKSGEYAHEYLPVNISDFFDSARIVQVSAGFWSSLALDENGHVWAWGNGENGRLGTGNDQQQLYPVNISAKAGSPLANVEILQISAGSSHALAIDIEGNVWVWGLNDRGQLGTGERVTRQEASLGIRVPNHYLPANISSLLESELEGARIVQVSAGATYSLALDEKGNVWAWGNGCWWQLGTGNHVRQYSPVNISSIEDSNLNGVDIVSVEAGRNAIAIDSDGNVWMWGDSWYRELGMERHEGGVDLRIPTNVSAMPDFIFYNVPIAQAQVGWMLLSKDGDIYVWGDGYRGRLGIGDISEWAIPFED